MKLTLWFLLVTLLVWPLSAAATDLDTTLREGQIFNSWGPALHASSLDLNQPIKGTPIAYEGGVAVYRVEGLYDGTVDYTLVSLPSNPMVNPEQVRQLDRAQLQAGEIEIDTSGPGHPETPLTPEGVSDLSTVSANVTYTTGDSVRCLIYAYRNEYYSYLQVITNLDHNALTINDSFDSLKTTCNGAFFFVHKDWGGSYLYMPANTALPVLSIYGFHDNISSLFHDLP